MVQQAAIGAGLRVMELINNDHGKGIWWNRLDAVRRQGLHTGKHVLPRVGSGAADIQLRKAAVSQDLPVRPQGLLKDLLAMRDK